MTRFRQILPFALFPVVVVGAQAVMRATQTEYCLTQLTMAVYYAIVVMGLCLLMGYAGQVSLGHGAFFAIGGYTSAVLTTHNFSAFKASAWAAWLQWAHLLVAKPDLYGNAAMTVSPWAAFLAAMAVTFLIAVLIGYPALRLRGHYLAMATLGLGIVISIVLKNEAVYTGGPDGMSVPPMSFSGWEISGERQWYWLFACVLLFSVWACLNLIDSPFGRALRALHGSEVASQGVGVDVARYKVAIFVLSAFFASIMGSLTAHYVGFVTPDTAEFSHSIELVTMVVVGGMASVYGSVIGAVLLTALPQALTTFEGWETVAFGTILMLSMIFLPNGLVPTLAARFRGGR